MHHGRTTNAGKSPGRMKFSRMWAAPLKAAYGRFAMLLHSKKQEWTLYKCGKICYDTDELDIGVVPTPVSRRSGMG